MSHPGTFGIEEEYLVVEKASGQIVSDLSPALIKHCHDLAGPVFSRELMGSEVEVSSPIFVQRSEAEAFFQRTRQRLNEGLAEEGLALYCASSHPTAQWSSQQIVDTPHHQELVEDYQRVARRSLLAGLHIHAGTADADRVQVLHHLLPWLPLFLILTTSSPCWSGERTGYMSYRRVVQKEWQRSDDAENIRNAQEYQRYRAFHSRWNLRGGIAHLWWPVRPSDRFPTLELRICDACPTLSDTLCAASLFQHLVRHCARLGPATQRTPEARWATEENTWRAARYGRHGQFIVPPSQVALNAEGWLSHLQACFPPDTDDSELAFADARRILRRGTSADQQLACYEKGIRRGLTHLGALQLAIDQVMARTIETQG